MMTNLNVGKKNPNVILGNRHDVCLLCARAKATEDQTSIAEAEQELQGHLEGQYVYRVPVNGQRLLICHGHIAEILSDLEEMIPVPSIEVTPEEPTPAEEV